MSFNSFFAFLDDKERKLKGNTVQEIMFLCVFLDVGLHLAMLAYVFVPRLRFDPLFFVNSLSKLYLIFYCPIKLLKEKKRKWVSCASIPITESTREDEGTRKVGYSTKRTEDFPTPRVFFHLPRCFQYRMDAQPEFSISVITERFDLKPENLIINLLYNRIFMNT